MYRYCLIVSQYRYSYHSFIVKVPADIATFKSCLLGVVEELERYKRKADDTREIHYGNLENLLDKNKEIFYSYNINDAGDIYIRNHSSINRLKDEAIQYEIKEVKRDKRYTTKKEDEDIRTHHSYDKIYQIIKKYFEIG